MIMITMFKRPAEFILLLGLVMALPLLEAPKNLLWGAWIITWLYHRVRDKDYGGPWDAWDSLIALLIASGYVGVAFAGLHNKEWGGANDILRYGSILWALKRSGYGEREFRWLIVTVIISTLIALGATLWGLYVSHSHGTLKLHSVGHVNHSAIYLAISYGIALAAVMAFWGRLGWMTRVAALFATGAFATGVFITSSRGAVGAMLVLTFFMSLAWSRRSKAIAAITMATLIATAYITYSSKVNVFTKHQGSVATDDVLSHRGEIWNAAVVTWRQFPLFGVGMGNYSQISTERIKQWVEASGRTYVASNYLSYAHGHSLYLNTLAERGLFGLGVLVILLSAWFYGLLRYLPGVHDENMAWMLWGGSLSAWLVTVGVGTVNTTLHHEHAILSVLMLGTWLAYLGSSLRPKKGDA
ncbi:MAG: O-antigen ligase family protein [Proteobacteria bacterium]|nr:O-antigen ligase family protein [Pseudomonadota bacterium]